MKEPEPELKREYVADCDFCEKPLYVGDTAYKIFKKYYCPDCIEFAAIRLRSEKNE